MKLSTQRLAEFFQGMHNAGLVEISDLKFEEGDMVNFRPSTRQIVATITVGSFSAKRIFDPIELDITRSGNRTRDGHEIVKSLLNEVPDETVGLAKLKMEAE